LERQLAHGRYQLLPEAGVYADAQGSPSEQLYPPWAAMNVELRQTAQSAPLSVGVTDQ
jgi:hypothetical protein